MNPIEQFYEKAYQIRFSELNAKGYLKPVKIFDYFQDIASEHTHHIGISALDLFVKNLTWVVIRYHVKIFHYPKWNQPIIIQTLRNTHKKLYELREFTVLDSDGTVLIQGRSVWVMLNTQSWKLVRLDRNLPNHLLTVNEVIDPEFMNISKLSQVDIRRNFYVRKDDLDVNQHVNNAVYIKWAIETIPDDIFQQCDLSEINVQFLNDSYEQEQISSMTQCIEHKEKIYVFRHSIQRNHDEKELSHIETRWCVFG
ncbi:MAG: hypothetical protein HQK77_15525 [Desulfobacterales bacterium]|nr:hypothetical protein [Desulfobacterales bacterium]